MYLDFWGSTVHILCGTAYGFVTPNSNSIAQTGTEVNKVKHTAPKLRTSPERWRGSFVKSFYDIFKALPVHFEN